MINIYTEAQTEQYMVVVVITKFDGDSIHSHNAGP